MNWDLNSMINFLWFFPLITFGIIIFQKEKQEKQILFTINALAISNFILTILLSGIWITNGGIPLNFKEFEFYQSNDYAFIIDFILDKNSFIFLWIGSLLIWLIVRYSSVYMHREIGFKRFFVTLTAFILGYNLVVIAGNFETLYVGWEFLGVSSFFLIAFYRHRYLPINNANQVFAVYRLGDIGLLLAMWASHHLWHENITFFKLYNLDLVHEKLLDHSVIGLFIASMLLLAASVKSAQVPFSYWMPRAMEGPTPSSAIFYGALSIHMGVFLLLRTKPFWEAQDLARILIALVGFMTAGISFFIARVQSNVKSQIAYASITQIGLMFIELAIGLENWVLVHFIGNAFLRTYQLLITPSVVNYLIREQFYQFHKQNNPFKFSLGEKIHYTIFWISLKEWFLEYALRKLIFYPAKRIGRFFKFINLKISLLLTIIISIAVISFYDNPKILGLSKEIIMSLLLSFGFLAVLKSYAEKEDPIVAYVNVFFSHLFTAYSTLFQENFNLQELYIFMSGHCVALLVGVWSLLQLKKREKEYFYLKNYLGHSYEHPVQAIIFFIACITMMGFPISPSFIGEDLIFSHIREYELYLAFISSLNFVFIGIALIRIYSLLFLGPHIKNYHELPYRYA